MASGEAFGAVHRRSDRRSRPGPDERGLPRLGLGFVSSPDVVGLIGLRLRDGDVLQPEARAGDLQLGGFSVHRGQRSSRPRHDRHVSAAVPEGDRDAVRRGSSAGARDGRSEDGHDRAGRDEDPRQRQPAQRAFLRVCGQDRSATEGRGRRSAGQGRGCGCGRRSRRHVDPRRTGAARGASAQDRRGAGDDRGARQGAARAREGGARSQDGRARGQDRRRRARSPGANRRRRRPKGRCRPIRST